MNSEEKIVFLLLSNILYVNVLVAVFLYYSIQNEMLLLIGLPGFTVFKIIIKIIIPNKILRINYPAGTTSRQPPEFL